MWWQEDPHEKQVRILKAPNVFAIQVSRVEDERRDVVRHAVVPEEELYLPGVGQFELAGVVYHTGRRPTSGHYHCACRGPDRMFWRGNDMQFTRATMDIERILPKQVYVLVYTRPRGAAVFAGMGDVGSAPARPKDVGSRTSAAGNQGAHGLGSPIEMASVVGCAPAKFDGVEGRGSTSDAGVGNPSGAEHEARSTSIDRPRQAPAALGHVDAADAAQAVGVRPTKKRRMSDAGAAGDMSAASSSGLPIGSEDVDSSLKPDAKSRVGGSFLKRRRGGGSSVE